MNTYIFRPVASTGYEFFQDTAFDMSEMPVDGYATSTDEGFGLISDGNSFIPIGERAREFVDGLWQELAGEYPDQLWMSLAISAITAAGNREAGVVAGLLCGAHLMMDDRDAMQASSAGGVSGEPPINLSAKLQARAKRLAELGVLLSHGFTMLVSSGDMKMQFAEMFVSGLISRVTRKETPSNELIRDVIGKMKGTGIIISGFFSQQFNVELDMAGRAIEDFFVIVVRGEKTYLATADEPEEDMELEVGRPEEIEVEVLTPADEVSDSRAMVFAGSMAGEGGAGTAVARLPSREALTTWGLPAEAVRALAEVSPELAGWTAKSLLELELSTDPQKVADAMRAIRKVYKFANSEEKVGLLQKLADIYLMYNEALKTEAAEDARRIRREVISALNEIGIRRDFVRELETFAGGTEPNKAISIQGLAASLHDGKWGTGETIKFAGYLVTRLVLAEIKSGSSATILSSALDAVHVIASDIISEGVADEFVSGLIVRASAKDVAEEGSVVYLGLRAILNVDKAAAIAAMEPQLRGSLFQETDVLIYRLLAEHYDDAEKRSALAKRMASDHVNIARMDRTIRRTLRETIIRTGEVAVSFIVDEYRRADAGRLLSPERRDDLIRMVFEIYAKLTPEQRRGLPPETREVVFERAADKLYSEYRTSEAVRDGVNSLDSINGQEMLSFYKTKAEAFGISQQERVFWIKQMAAKAASLERADSPAQAGIAGWAFTESLKLFEEYGNEHFEAILLFFSSPAVPAGTIKAAFERISATPRNSRLPGRDRAVLMAMAGNRGLSRGFLVGTVGKKLEEIADKVFQSETAMAGLQFTEKELAEEVASVTLQLDHDSDVSIGEELRGALVTFVKERKGRYAFNPKTGKLSIKGEMSANDQAELSRILGVTHNEKVRIGKLELPERIDRRLAEIRSLREMAAEKARQSKAQAETLGAGLAGTFFIDDADLAADISDDPPLKRFEDAVEGLARLCKNARLDSAEKEYYLAKLIDIHYKALDEVFKSSQDAGSLDSWSYPVVRQVVEMFTNGVLGSSSSAARTVTFMMNELLDGYLSVSSRRTLWKIFTDQIERFRNVASVKTFLTGRIRAAIGKNPGADWSPEKEFLAVIEAEQ